MLNKTFRKILLKLIAFMFMFTSVAVSSRHFEHNKVTNVSAAELVEGPFVLPDSAKWVYIHPTLGLDTNSGKTPDAPFQSLVKAQKEVPYQGAIMVLADMTLSATFHVLYDLIITSSPILMDGNPNEDIFTIKRDEAFVGNLFQVSYNIELHLANIIIDGNRELTADGHVTGAVIWVGTGHGSYQGALYLHMGAVVMGGNRTFGGGAVILQRGLLYMNGGKVTHNYAVESYPVIGGLLGSSNNKIYLISGEISHNIGTAITVGPVFDNIWELYIGGDFLFHNNVTNDYANYLPYSEFGTHIINNFTVRRKLDVDAVAGDVLDAIVIVDENFAPLNPKLETIMFLEAANDPSLYLQYDSNINHYVWRSLTQYSAEHEVIVKPTVDTTGLLGRKAYLYDDIDGNPVYDDHDYIDEVVLPKLNTVNYTNIHFDAVASEAVYEYVYNLKVHTLRYNAPFDNYLWEVTLAPTETTEGSLAFIHPLYPGVIFDTIILPILDVSDHYYIVTTTATHIVFTMHDTLGVFHEFLVVRPLFNYTASMRERPTATKTGSADILHPDYPGIIFGTFVLPKLNAYDYDLIIVGDELTYRYFHNMSGTTVSVSMLIPRAGYIISNVMVAPSADNMGIVTLVHGDAPGYERHVMVPVLSGEDYTIAIEEGVDESVGEVVYTYFDHYTNTYIPFRLPYDYTTLTWDYGVSPTLTTTGSINGTSLSLPGTNFVIELPILSSEFYNISEAETTLTYTLKDETYGTFSFTINKAPVAPPDGPEEPDVPGDEHDEEPSSETPKLWPYIVGAVAVLLLAGGAAIITLKLRTDKKEKSEPTSDSQE